MHLGEPAHVVKRRSLDQQLRIHLVYDSGLSDLPQEKETLVKVTIIFRTLNNNNNIDFYLAHTHEIHINALYNTNKHNIKNKNKKPFMYYYSFS